MFQSILNWIKKVITSMFPRNTIKNAVGTELAVSDKMSKAITLWGELYQNEASWLSDDVKSLNLATAISSELARLATLEFDSKIIGSPRANFLEEQYKLVRKDLRVYTEYGCAGGGLIFKPYISGDKIAVDYVRSDSFFPISFGSNGKITACIFVDRKRHGGKYYTRLENHFLEESGVRIKNKAFSSLQKTELGSPCPLSVVPEWGRLEEEAVVTGTKQMLFGYFKYPAANQIDEASPLGVSAFSRAVGLIEEADKQYSRILWEFEGSELAVYADITALERKPDSTYALPKMKKRLLKGIEIENLYEVFSPAIRDEALFHGLDELLKKIEFVCGMSYGIISNPQEISKTATEIKSSKQRMFQTVSDIQSALETALNDLIYAMNVWASVGRLAPEGEYEVTYDWDDSIVKDKEEERALWLQEIREGIRQKYEYRMKFLKEDEATARANVEASSNPFGDDV